jgi:hypothetical protein
MHFSPEEGVFKVRVHPWEGGGHYCNSKVFFSVYRSHFIGMDLAKLKCLSEPALFEELKGECPWDELR